MNKQELAEITRSSWRALEAELVELSDEQMLLPGVGGDWSVKDVLAHISAWERMFIRDIEHVMRGEEPEQPELWTGQITGETNSRIFAENRDRPLADVHADSRASHETFVGVIDRLSDADLFDAQRFPQAYGNAIAPWFRDHGDQHYAEHHGQIARWRSSLG
ncbi:MAG: ClbS/DfsB family four-helix bundle protein [Dehalococcoidia bacterium]